MSPMRPFRLRNPVKKGDGSRKLLEVIAQEAIVGIAAFDPISRMCTDINRVAQESLAVGFGEDLKGQNLQISDLFPGENREGQARAFSDEIFSTEGLFQDLLVRRKDGLNIIANVAIKHVTIENDVRRVLVMFQDVTVQKKMQRDLELKREEIRNAYAQVLKQNKQLRDLDNAKDRFIALTTHELRTPLSAIVATAEVLQLKLCESDEQRDDFIKTLYEQGLHLMELVNDILDFAKISAGKMDLYVEHVDLASVVGKLVGGFEQMAAQSQVTLEIEAPEGPIMAYADALRIKEVVSNVVNNAIKFNRSGGRVNVRFENRAGQKNGEECARIVIEDTGVGIPFDRLPHVFNEFETVGHVARHHKGTGLGMPISKRLVEAMGGEISLESVENRGTTFFIDIPCEKVLSPENYRSRPEAWDQAA